jgi:hypothetical protein
VGEEMAIEQPLCGASGIHCDIHISQVVNGLISGHAQSAYLLLIACSIWEIGKGGSRL